MHKTALRVPALLLLVTLLVSAVALPRQAAYAQDAKIVCDSDLILSLYIASDFFSLGTILEGLAASPVGAELPVVDISNLELGQYELLFADIDPENSMIDEATIDAIVAQLTIPESDRMTAQLDPANALQPAVITGETADCSILRAQLNFFYTLVGDLT